MKRRRKLRLPQRQPDLSGITAADCCTSCVAYRCAISGKAYCGHPRKGGLQSAEMRNAAAVARLAAAGQMLGDRNTRFY